MIKILKFVGLLFALLLAVIGLFIAFNYTYLERLYTGSSIEQVREVDWYEPTVELSPDTQTAELFISEPQLARQEEQFAAAIDYAEKVNSSAFLVWQDGKLLAEKYWSPYNADNYTQTHSIHKSLLSMAVGIAVSEGDIESIHDPVSKYLGEWTSQSKGQISIENLLNMSSGLGKEPAKIFIFSHFLRLLNALDISEVAQSLPQKLAPGVEFEYINTNPQLLVDVLEVATGQSYEDYLSDKIWSKMAADPGYLWMDRENGTPHGYCCLIARPEDLLRIGLLVLNKGQANGQQVVPKEWIQQATQPSKLNPNYGYLIWRGTPYTPLRKYYAKSSFGVAHSEPYLADDVLFFDGFGGQRVYIVPSKKLVIVRVGETRFDFDDSILPNRVIEALDTPQEFKVGYKDTVINTKHSGEVKVHLAYPQNAEQEFPLIVFSHGNFLDATSYDNLIEKWVTKGYVVAAPAHLDAGGREAGMAADEKYGSDWVTASRVLDMSATIDQLPGLLSITADFKGTLNTHNVIAAGHSYGALAAQLLAGATLETLGNSTIDIPEPLMDDRVVGVVAISPPGLFPGRISEKTWATLNKPQFVVTGTADVVPPFWPTYEAHLVSYENAMKDNNYLLVLDKMDHYLGNLIGRLDREEAPQELALNNLAEQSLNFMEAYLKPSDAQLNKLKNIDKIQSNLGIVRYEVR
ncbi:alpha/beta fold hydrolase [Paraglaciecola sp. 2405UD69-4]|uniref:alpha/beta fold hydrolase n=1 Tax=Paraglaciecola sp. 2405UD69-4 TaxID=3391836 RepID=UPI0039C9460C